MRRVWRIEHAEKGYGPYSYGDWPFSPFCGFQEAMEDADVFHDLSSRHPVSGWWSKEKFGAGLRFGFSSLKQLREWFDYFGDYGYDILRDHGFHLVAYDVPDSDVMDCDKQITFNIERATVAHEEEL